MFFQKRNNFDTVPAAQGYTAIAKVNPGTHILLDIYDADSSKLKDVQALEELIAISIDNVGTKIVGKHLSLCDETGGITAIFALNAGHISMHTWPESHYGAFDIFISGKADPVRVAKSIQQSFGGAQFDTRVQKRGKNLAAKGYL